MKAKFSVLMLLIVIAMIAIVVWQTIMPSLLLAVIAILIIAAIAYFIVAKQLKPLEQLSKTAGMIAQGRTGFYLDINSKDEIGRVSHAFMAISDAIGLMKDQFEEAEHAISHGDVYYRMENESLQGAFQEIIGDVNKINGRMAGFLDFLTTPVSIIGSDFIVKYTNKKLRDITNIRAAVIRQGKHVNEVFNTDMANNPAFLKALQEGVHASDELVIQLNANEDRKYNITLDAIPIKEVIDEEEQIIAVFLLLTDVSGIRDAARIAEKSNNYRREQLKRLTDSITTAFAQGNLAMKISRADGYDEETMPIALEFDSMGLTLIHSIERVKSYVDELQQTLGEMSRKDFTSGIKGDYVGDFTAIKDSVNTIFSDMNRFFAEILNSSGQVRTGVNDIATTARDLSSSFSQQLNLVTQINDYVANITGDINQNLNNTQEATRLSSATKADAQNGSTQMAEMMEAMEDIRNSSAEIAKVINTINDIAFQTNLLALNASVEAARAGEHGKGFAVVADEVRSLATRSAKAAKDSTDMINESIGKVAQGVEIAENTANALNKIVEAVAEIDNTINTISESSTKQTRSITQIEASVQDINSMTKNNVEVVTQNANTANELVNHTDDLQSMITQFKLLG
ncbi:MAG: methyl-accepting chemotaxis protein [Defluviitaleaceae bacterium]|nr:methyl-accepting chemotaxis protein [Defluviitaleaceae bacterium]